MAFPTIPTVAAGRVLSVRATAPSGTHTSPNLTSLTKNAGDLLIAIVIIYDGNSTNAEFSAWGGGFTEFKDQAGTATMGIGLAYKWSTGSETGTFNVTSADTSANDSAFFLLSIAGAHATTPPEAGTMVTGTTAAANPASFDPAGWAAEDTLWIAIAGSGETGTGGQYTGVASAPTNYGNYAESGISADVVGGVEGAVAFRQLNAASEDVGTFGVDLSNARNAAIVVAVRPDLLQIIDLGLIDAGAAIYAPTLTPKNTITLDLIDAGAAIYAPVLLPVNTITLGLLDAGSAIYDLTVVPGPVTITLSLLDGGAAIYALSAIQISYITLGLIDAGAAIYAPTLTTLNTIDLGLIDGGAAIYALTVIPDQFITLGFLDAGAAIYDLTLTQGGGPQTIILGFLDAGPAIYDLTLTPKNTISLGFLDAGPAIYDLTLANTQIIVLGLIDAGAAIYALTLANTQIIVLGLIDAGAAIYALTVVDAGSFQTIELALIDGGAAIYDLVVEFPPAPLREEVPGYGGGLPRGAAKRKPVPPPAMVRQQGLMDSLIAQLGTVGGRAAYAEMERNQVGPFAPPPPLVPRELRVGAVPVAQAEPEPEPSRAQSFYGAPISRPVGAPSPVRVDTRAATMKALEIAEIPAAKKAPGVSLGRIPAPAPVSPIPVNAPPKINVNAVQLTSEEKRKLAIFPDGLPTNQPEWLAPLADAPKLNTPTGPPRIMPLIRRR